MEGREKVMREKRLYDASLSGRVESLNELMQEDELTIARVTITCFNETPLHVAALLGHVEFAKALVRYNPSLITELDSQHRSPLHLASANGYVEIVKLLLMADSNVCLVQDEDGRTPLHLAAMKGRVDIVNELVRVRPQVIRYELTRGETILHSCVICNRLESLKQLVEAVDEGFVNVQDDNGNTILHTAALLKRMEIMTHLLNMPDVSVDTVNANGLTALDIIEQMPRDLKTMEILQLLVNTRAPRGRDVPTPPYDTHGLATPPESVIVPQPAPQRNNIEKKKRKKTILEKRRDSILVVATVIAAMAYQAGLNPPSGVWQDDKNSTVNGHTTTFAAGTSIMATRFTQCYPVFWLYNTVSLIASLTIILLLVSGISLKQRFSIWLTMVAMWVTITFMALTYLISIQVITPKNEGFEHEFSVIFGIANASGYIWFGLIGIAFLVHTCRFIMWIVMKDRKWRERRASRNGNEDQSKIGKCISFCVYV